MLEMSKQIPHQIESLRDYFAALHFSTQTQPSTEFSLLNSKVDRLRHDFCVQRDEQPQRRQRTPSPPTKFFDKDASGDESSDDEFANDEYSTTMLNKLSHNTASSSPETKEGRKDTSEDSQTFIEEPPLVSQIDDGVQEDPVSPSASPDPPNEEMPPATQNSELSDEEDNDDTSSVEFQVEEDEDEIEEDDDSSIDIQTEAIESEATFEDFSQHSVDQAEPGTSSGDAPEEEQTQETTSIPQPERQRVEQQVDQLSSDAEEADHVQENASTSNVEQQIEQQTVVEVIAGSTTVAPDDIGEITSNASVDEHAEQQIEPQVEQQFQPSVRDADTFQDAQENTIISGVDAQPEEQPEAQPAPRVYADMQPEAGINAQPEVEAHDEMENQTSENVSQLPNTDPVMVELLLQGFNTYGERHNIEKQLYDLRDTECDRQFEDLIWDIEGARDDILAGQIQSQERLQVRLVENLDRLVAAETKIASGIAGREKEERDREEKVRQERRKMEFTAAAYLQRIGTRKDAFPLSVEGLNSIDRYVDDGRISSDAQLKSALALHEEELQKAEAGRPPLPQPLTAVIEQHDAVQGGVGVQEQAQPTKPVSADDVRDVNGQPPDPLSAPQEPPSSEQAPAAWTPIQEGPERPPSTFQWPDPMQWDAKGAKAEYYNQLVAKQQSTQRGKIIKRSGAEMESQLSLTQLHEINDSKDDKEAMQDARAEMGQDVEDAQVFILDDPDREMAGNSVAQYSWDEEQENEWAGSMF